ncbi:MAG: glycosyl hydrolase family 18 protein [Candidatus Dojkabacteria bacterium]
MNSLRTVSFIGIIVGLSLLLFSCYILILDRNATLESKLSDNTESTVSTSNPTKETEEEIEEDTSKEEENIVEEIPLKESGWIPNWAFELGLESLKNNLTILDTVNPVLYSIKKDGTLESRKASTSNIQELSDISKTEGIKIVPTIGSYDYESINSLLKNATTYTKNISSIIAEVEKYNFDGIDLDFEQVESKNKEMYFKYLRDLRLELSKREKTLSVTVFAQWENGKYKNNAETISVQDYTLLGEIADEVRIMGYDYTLSTSNVAGAIGPINWLKDVLGFATKYIPKEKIWLGVHLYGYEWVGSKTEALTYTSVEKILNSGIASSFKKEIGEGYAKFSCAKNTTTCEMYYQTKEGIALRRELAKTYEIEGISYWRLGGELDLLQ